MMFTSPIILSSSIGFATFVPNKEIEVTFILNFLIFFILYFLTAVLRFDLMTIGFINSYLEWGFVSNATEGTLLVELHPIQTVRR